MEDAYRHLDRGTTNCGGNSEQRTVSFRSRLLLFFMIIVIVPMVAVALVLFSITADSETGKADAQIAQGLRAAFAIYDRDRAAARAKAQRVAGDPKLAAALMQRDTAAVAKALQRFAPGGFGVRRVAVYDSQRRQIAEVGNPAAVASAVAAPASNGRQLGFVAVSTTTADEFAND